MEKSDETTEELMGSLREYLPAFPLLLDALDSNQTLRLYSHGEYSDLTISCGERHYRVHKSLVCQRLDFLATACRGDFKVGCIAHNTVYRIT